MTLVNFIEKGFMNNSKNFKSIINYASEKVVSLNEIETYSKSM